MKVNIVELKQIKKRYVLSDFVPSPWKAALLPQFQLNCMERFDVLVKMIAVSIYGRINGVPHVNSTTLKPESRLG